LERVEVSPSGRRGMPDSENVPPSEAPRRSTPPLPDDDDETDAIAAL
jgi:hypothetical protein